ncbi:MAG: DUF1887 family protein [Prevotellaceae bacterium]|jgi:hypothetical protein|nr:DUF1887 family protein [Prevotellaceae bacterium]
MAKTYLISLISNHLLPNYLFIKEMAGKYDDLLFISTEKMEDDGLGKRLEKALGVKENAVQQIVVSEENLNETLAKLKSVPFSNDDRFMVNLTCGTKIMSIGVYEYFSKFISSFYYIPIGKNKIENVGTSGEIPLNYRVNLEEYLTLYGITFQSDRPLIYPQEHTFNLFERYKKNNFNRYRILEILNAQNHTVESDKVYYSGGWFEEYCYLKIKQEKGLNNDCIYQSIKLFRNNSGLTNDNEIDVMYVSENKLYVCECKVSLKGRPMVKDYELLEQYMYKLAAISKDFGLIVNPYILTLHRFEKISPARKQAIEKRMKILGIKDILNSNTFKQVKLNI